MVSLSLDFSTFVVPFCFSNFVAAKVKPGEVYPFRFFPHCRGPNSGGTPPLTSLHKVTDRLFHEGVSLDSHDKDRAMIFMTCGQLVCHQLGAFNKLKSNTSNNNVTFIYIYSYSLIAV